MQELVLELVRELAPGLVLVLVLVQVQVLELELVQAPVRRNR